MTQAEARAGGTRYAVRPVDFHQHARVLEGRKGRHDAQCAGVHDISCVADIHKATGEIIQDPALPFTIGLAGALRAAQRGERHTGDEAWCRSGEPAHVVDLELVEGGVHDIDALLIG